MWTSSKHVLTSPKMSFGRRSTFAYKCVVSTIVVIAVVFIVRQQQHNRWSTSVDTLTQGELIVEQPVRRDVDLVILIVSAPTKAVTRDVIRQTWLSTITNHSKVRYFFVIGLEGLSTEDKDALHDEQRREGDLALLAGLADSYANLAEKTIQALQWTKANFNHFGYILKCDDDSFVRVNELVKALDKQPSQRLYWGFFKGGTTVHRRGKWAEADWFVCDRYVPYAVGGGYVLSADLVRYLNANADLLQRYRSEDVSLGLWLAPLRIHRVHDPRFDTEYRSRGCHDDYLVTHKQTASDMKEKHRSLTTSGRLCATQLRKRYSYNYNWTAVPSECCKNFDPDLP